MKLNELNLRTKLKWFTSTPHVNNLNTLFNWVNSVQTADDPFGLKSEVNEQGEIVV